MTPDYGELAARELPDGRVLAVTPLTYGKARLHVASPASRARLYYDDEW